MDYWEYNFALVFEFRLCLSILINNDTSCFKYFLQKKHKWSDYVQYFRQHNYFYLMFVRS